MAGGTACPTTEDQAVAARWDRRFRLSDPFFRSLSRLAVRLFVFVFDYFWRIDRLRRLNPLIGRHRLGCRGLLPCQPFRSKRQRVARDQRVRRAQQALLGQRGQGFGDRSKGSRVSIDIQVRPLLIVAALYKKRSAPELGSFNRHLNAIRCREPGDRDGRRIRQRRSREAR